MLKNDKILTVIFFLFSASFAFLPASFAATTNSQTWEGQYNCDVLPTDAGWIASPNANSYASVANGVLTVDSLGANLSPYWSLDNPAIDFSTGYSLEWRIKLINAEYTNGNACCLSVADGSNYISNSIAIGNIYLASSAPIVMDPQDGFHVYRLIVNNGLASLYVDYNPVPVLQMTAPASGSFSLSFGDFTGSADAKYEIDYIRWTNEGAFKPSVTANSYTWEGQYDCNVLPTDAGWTASTNANNYAAVSNGILTVDSMGTNLSPYWTLNNPAIDFSTGYSLEWRVKLIDAEYTYGAACNINVSDGSNSMSNTVALGNTYLESSATSMDTQDGFHVYRLVVDDGTASLYIDYNPTPVMQMTAPSGGGFNVRFGDLTSTADAKYEIDYIRWTNRGAFRPFTSTNSQTWEGQYDCEVLPTNADWTASPNADSYASVDNGILTVDSSGTNLSPYWSLNNPAIDFSTGYSLEWKVKLINAEYTYGSACNLGVSDGFNSMSNSIATGNTYLASSAVSMDTQDDFHIYRLVVDNGTASLYIDNNSTPVMQMNAPTGTGSNVRFGDLTGIADAAYEIDYIRWTNTGAFVPCVKELIVDIDFFDEIEIRRTRGHAITEQETRSIVANLANNGVDTILLNVGGAELCYQTTLQEYPRVFNEQEVRDNWYLPYFQQYVLGAGISLNDYIAAKSEYINMLNTVLANYNPPAVIIDEAHARGMKVIIWIKIFDDWWPGFGLNKLENYPWLQWTAKDGTTYFKGVMSYAFPESRNFRVAQVQELLALGADGIHCSMSSHPRHLTQAADDAFGYEQPVVDEYYNRYGINILTATGWNQDAWHEIKGEFMTALYEALAAECHALGKEFWIGLPLGDYDTMAASSYWTGNIVARYKLDWQQWVDNGIADALIIGDYEIPSQASFHAPSYWTGKGLAAYMGDLFQWSADTYIAYCRNKTKLYLWGEWLDGGRTGYEAKVNQFRDRVLIYGFDGVDIHEAMMFESNGDLLKPVSNAFKFLVDAPDPGQAASPNPAHGITGVNVNAELSWTTDSNTTLHEIYFGTSQANVQNATHASSEYKGSQTAALYTPATILGNTTYYWRIDEVGNGIVTKGAVWSFTTAN